MAKVEMKLSPKVKKYRNLIFGPEFWYQRDARKMAKKNYLPASVQVVTKRRGCLGALIYWFLFGWLFALLFQQKNHYLVVTYSYQPAGHAYTGDEIVGRIKKNV